jgi:hypothetical protein
MASTYSTNLALELIGNGDQAGTWGTTTNTNLGTLLEQAISGYATQAVATGTDTTITIPNGASGVARNMYIELTGTGGASTNLIVPANKKLYFIYNHTSSGQVTVKVSGQTGVSVPNGSKVLLVCNGTDIVNATSYPIGSGTVNYIPKFTGSDVLGDSIISTSAFGVGINVASPAYGLDVRIGSSIGITNASGNASIIIAGGSRTWGLVSDNPTGAFQIADSTGGAIRATFSTTGGFSLGTTANPGAGAIYATGNITAYYSDDRLKTRKGNIENALDKVLSLDGFHYEANEVAQALGYEAKPEVGLSAQQVQAVLPEVVAPAPIDAQYLTLHYERVVPLLVEAIKELNKKVEALEANKCECCK